jgi:hypothetical protein
MLVGFVAQQFICCCAGACVSSCDHSRHVNLISSAVDSNECDCGHHHDSQPVADSCISENQSEPAHQDRHHHICVGTHLFYLSAERFNVSQLAMSHRIHSNWADIVELLATIGTSPLKTVFGDGPRINSALSRAALCVYRI